MGGYGKKRAGFRSGYTPPESRLELVNGSQSDA